MSRISLIFCVILCCVTLYAGDINNIPYLQKYFKEQLRQEHYNFIIPEVAGMYYKMLKDIDYIFNYEGIKYWIMFGTLLGAARHKGLIAWDDDLDIEVFEQDKAKIMNSSLLKEYGYKAEHWPWGGVSIRPIVKYEVDVKLDVFTTRVKKNKVVLATAFYTKSDLMIKEVDKLVRIPFGPIEVNAPSNYMRFLKDFYGKDVMTHARLRPTSARYTIKDFSPAEYVW